MNTANDDRSDAALGAITTAAPTPGTQATGLHRRRRRSARLLAVEIATPVAALVVIMLWTANAGLYTFPPLAPILLDFPRTWLIDRFVSDVVPSITRLTLGFALAAVVAVPLGLLLGQSSRVRAVVTPALELVRAIPAPALIPLVILILGIGDAAKVILIAAVCVWPVLLNTIDGVAGLEPLYRQTALVYRIGFWQRQRHIFLVGALPRIFAGLRIATALSLIMVVVSEMAASQNGIGFTILVAQRNFALSTMWSGIILLGLLGYLSNLFFEILERYVLAWNRSVRSGSE